MRVLLSAAIRESILGSSRLHAQLSRRHVLFKVVSVVERSDIRARLPDRMLLVGTPLSLAVRSVRLTCKILVGRFDALKTVTGHVMMSA